MAFEFHIFSFTERGERLGHALADKLRASAAQAGVAGGQTWVGVEQAQVEDGQIGVCVERAGVDAGQARVDGEPTGVDAGQIRVEVYRVKALAQTVQPLFKSNNVLVFIGAAGIAVRAIAPLLVNKAHDPAVIVIDEAGDFVIPIVSGHIGGANRYARMIAAQLDATAVITTATDVNHIFSFDAFASAAGYTVLNPGQVKPVAAAMLAGQQVGLCSDFPIDGALPNLVVLHEQVEQGGSGELDKLGELGVYICDPRSAAKRQPFSTTLRLVPRIYYVGIGSRKDISHEQVDSLFLETLERHRIPLAAVAGIASIDLKQNEPAIVSLAEKHGVGFSTFSAEQLNTVSEMFDQSAFVQSTTGTGNVAEAAAYLASGGGTMIQARLAIGGVTLAIACENWRVSFEDSNGWA